MSATVLGARQGEKGANRLGRSVLPAASRRSSLVTAASAPNSVAWADYSFVNLGDSTRIALMLAPKGRGPLAEQVQEVLSALQSVMAQQPQPMVITIQTVFLREASDQADCERLFAAHYGPDLPVTSFVLQPPCNGAALVLEVWAIGGKSARVERFGPHALAVSHDSVRWVYCGGIGPASSAPARSAGGPQGVYAQTTEALEQVRGALTRAGSGYEHVVRTWFYLGGITQPEAETQRYKELNRARTDFYRPMRFGGALLQSRAFQNLYPASTGIGMRGAGLMLSCLTLQTRRADAFLVPLENPLQTPAYAYHSSYSPYSPKFSRAMALVLGDYATTWISGTASIVNSESRHPGDIEKQTEQTIDNIEQLIAPANFALHGLKNAGAQLHDLAKIRVYVKRPGDFARCKAICERRFGPVPAIYALADVCRPELLVEIEGAAFSRCAPTERPAS
jgi:enamine deaminase RidA (YjgF/YER057c/UK114 family)